MSATENTACGAIGSMSTKNDLPPKKLTTLSGIHGLKNNITNKWYIGQSINIPDRWKTYSNLECRKQRKLFNALLKYGYDEFEKVVLEGCAPDVNVLNPREDYWIDYYDSINGGYNIRRAGGKGPTPQETKDRMSNSQKGRPCPEYKKKLISERLLGKYSGEKHPMFGKKHSEETKQKIRASRAKQVITKEHRENMSKALMGKKVDQETKKRLSEADRGKVMSQDTRRKMSLAKIGRKMPDEVRRRISETMRKLKQSAVATHNRPVTLYL